MLLTTLTPSTSQLRTLLDSKTGTSIFLEVFGNALVQERTAKYIEKKSKQLIKLVCDGEGVLGDMFDFSLLKYRERDELESALKRWRQVWPFPAISSPILQLTT